MKLPNIYKRFLCAKGAITSKIKHATVLKTSPARVAQLMQPSSAFCFSLQPMTGHWTMKNVGRHEVAIFGQTATDFGNEKL